MNTLANLDRFESLQNSAHVAMGFPGGVFNASYTKGPSARDGRFREKSEFDTTFLDRGDIQQLVREIDQLEREYVYAMNLSRYAKEKIKEDTKERIVLLKEEMRVKLAELAEKTKESNGEFKKEFDKMKDTLFYQYNIKTKSDVFD